jgi:Ca2+-binding RTX toxin-like protein
VELGTITRICVAIAIGLGAANVALGAAGDARAGTVAKSGDRLVFTADPGETNRVVVTRDAHSYTVRDDGAPLAAGPGCTSTGPNEAVCPRTGVYSVEIHLGDLDDTGELRTTGSIDGDDGADTLLAGQGFSTVRAHGGDGNDTLIASGFSVTLYGDEGADSLTPADATTLVGGPGSDTFDPPDGSRFFLSYRDKTTPVAVDADGIADDGELGEGDNLLPSAARFGWVWGGDGPDTLLTGGGVGCLKGFGGDDFLDARGQAAGDCRGGFSGGAGDDHMLGGVGANEFNGGPGADTLSGGPGPDRLAGGRGGDRIGGGPGADVVRGERGRDALDAGPGNDVLDGGRNHDVLWGRAGNDSLAGGRDGDLLLAGVGDDTIEGERGNDEARGGPGRDTFRMRDTFRDVLHGGPGLDRAEIDPGLDTVFSIEFLSL